MNLKEKKNVFFEKKNKFVRFSEKRQTNWVSLEAPSTAG